MSAVTAAAPTSDPAADVAADRRVAAALRVLSVDAVAAAGSGHPGAPLGLATVLWELVAHHVRLDPDDVAWADRDRLVLSAGHASALLYALGHLVGTLPPGELARFRQWGSLTPGHPEHGHTAGVETTTGPLGAGLATAVGLALGERLLAARAPHDLVDHRTWVLVGDGCLMEGVSHEAASLAGTLGLGRLTVVWDDNDVTIDGPASASCRDDVLGRFAAYGWDVLRVDDGEDVVALRAAFAAAAAGSRRPSLVAVRTVIGRGAPGVQGTSAAHGAPLTADDLAALRADLGWEHPPFVVPDDVGERVAAVLDGKRSARRSWQARQDDWRREAPDEAAAFDAVATGVVPADLETLLPRFEPGTSIATRVASGRVLAALLPHVPALVGGSADLAHSTGTALPAPAVGDGDFSGRLVRFGIREQAMGHALNGLALHGLRPFGSTFLVFSDYARPAIRLSALMGLPVVHVMTHDSVRVGEDGPTHQPVEQLESLRLVPGLDVLRPADANETAACWAGALRSGRPTALVLSRQDLPVLPAAGLDRLPEDGCRVVRDTPEPDVVLVATGSEVSLALEAADLLARQGTRARVVSVPDRDRAERSGALARSVGRAPAVALEAGSTRGWWATLAGARATAVVGVDRFGASGPGDRVAAELGLTAEHVARTAARLAAPGP
ncbi:transketolase [Kineosporia sp. R_H_3]|uniref:transketolase n=1 Tax=Kineosporia sp. R_H_3 TaxID=1961848 RepID=UPI0018EA1A4D|nr:transketolase [Kineosporia sp. R_H_3]